MEKVPHCVLTLKMYPQWVSENIILLVNYTVPCDDVLFLPIKTVALPVKFVLGY